MRSRYCGEARGGHQVVDFRQNGAGPTGVHESDSGRLETRLSEGPFHMMFIISLLLFLGGLFLFGVAYMVTSFQGLVFTAGILAVCVAMAIPMFRSQWRTKHHN